MSITFMIGNSINNIQSDNFVVLEPEVSRYFEQINSRKGIDLSLLIKLDPYGDTVIAGESLIRLDIILDELLHSLQSMYQQQSLPEYLEPPKVVGLETDALGDPCGRIGLVQFVSQLKDLVQDAKGQDNSIIAIGD